MRDFKLFRFFLIVSCLLFVFAVPPAKGAADEEIVAANFLKFLRSDKIILFSESIEESLLDPSLAPITVARLFHLQGGGYILVSPDRSVSPVKAYSLAGNFAALPPAYRRALLAELELRVRVAQPGAVRTLEAGMTETERQWDFLLSFDTLRMLLEYTAGTSLLTARWNQGYPYNKFLPAMGDQTVVAGCVNVAAGQIMRYYNYPAASRGVISYTWNSQTLKTILYRGYHWDNMPDTLDEATPEYQVDEVALLLKDLGFANRTDYDATGSSTFFRSDVLTENFGYSTFLAEMNNSNFGDFLAKLKSEIDAERPVLLTFPGHMTVADGYSADDAGQKIHVNMGWGGSDDNFYFLDRTVETTNYDFPTTAGALHIYFNVKPCSVSAGDCAVNLEAGDGLDGLAITGNFDREKDQDVYEVYLKDATTISATRGYSNVAFFVSIIAAADGSEVFPAPNPDDVTLGGNAIDVGIPPEGLSAGKYLVRISLCNDSGTSCYLLAAGHDNYTVVLTSGDLAAEEEAVIDSALDKAPVIGNAFPDLLLSAAAPTRKILIDARDENGDPVSLSVGNSNPAAVGAVINGDILELTPTGTAKVSSRIVVTAAANGRKVEKSFTVMTDDETAAYGNSFTIGGTFGSQDDVRTHRVILEGACTITGRSVGYSGQGFFSSIRNADGTARTAPGDDEITDTFDRGIYLLDASLEQNPGGTGTYYPYILGDGDRYVFTVSCPNAVTETATIAGLLGIDLAGADLPTIATGDINGDGGATLADAILALQLLGGMDMTGITIYLQADTNGDGKLGMADALFILQTTAGLRLP